MGLRQDEIALICGIAFLVVIEVGIWIGGYIHWEELGVYLNLYDPRFPQEKGESWYTWQSPEPGVGGYLSSWLCYLGHQFTVWALIYKAQYQKTTYSSKLRRFNWELLAVNGFFHILHLIQTHVFYTALADSVTVWSSQASVIAILVFALLIMNDRPRGLFFGKRIPLPKSVTRLVSKYHAYLFAWGTIYTFWYHPMENSFGHLLGFAYTGLLMLQSSLIYTPIHMNQYWILILEIWVILHGPTISVQKNDGAWAMFTFGFLIVFAGTQIFVFPWWPKAKKWFWVRLIPILAVIGAAVGVFVAADNVSNLYRIVFIPLALWGLVFVETGLIWVVFRATNACCPMTNVINKPPKCCRGDNEQSVEEQNSKANKRDGSKGLPMRIIGSIAAVLLLLLMVAIAILLQFLALDSNNVLTLVTYFSVGIISPLTIIGSGYALNFRNIRRKGAKLEMKKTEPQPQEQSSSGSQTSTPSSQ